MKYVILFLFSFSLYSQSMFGSFAMCDTTKIEAGATEQAGLCDRVTFDRDEATITCLDEQYFLDITDFCNVNEDYKACSDVSFFQWEYEGETRYDIIFTNLAWFDHYYDLCNPKPVKLDRGL